MTPAVEADGRCAIRARNAKAILDAALEVLNADPRAGMHEIAARAGVGRATLYRHYPAREDLVAAIEERAQATFDGLLTALRDSHAGPGPALEQFVDGLLALREGYACIAASSPPKREAQARELWAPLGRHLGRLQADGVLDAGPAQDWMLAAFRGLLRAAVTELDSGRLRRDDAPAAVVRTLLHGMGA